MQDSGFSIRRHRGIREASMNEGHRWQRGDTMLVRYVRDGMVRAAQPMRVVDDQGDFLALYIWPGTPAVRMGDMDGKHHA
jgi:hypothetical protein